MNYEGFGKYLVQQRELRGLSRDEVARSTKIPLAMIAALESGRVDQLPGRVFILNYIRAYAQVIGVEPDEAILRFEELDTTMKTEPPPAALERLVDHPPHVTGLRDIDAQCERWPAQHLQLGGRLAGPPLVDVGDDDVRPLGGKHLSHRAADAIARPGNHRDFPLQPRARNVLPVSRQLWSCRTCHVTHFTFASANRE